MAKSRGHSRLTHNFVKSVAKEGRYGDGRGGLGLSLLVKRTANWRWSKTWSQRIRVKGRLRTVGIGSFPVVTLAMARDKVLDNARRVEQGEDILKPTPPIPTVDEAFDRVIADRKKSWEGEQTLNNWRRIKQHCKPIGSKLVSEVMAKDVLNLITPLWHKAPDNARTIRSKLSIVMEWSITEGLRKETNPAGPSVTKSLGKQDPVTHHDSLDPSQLGSALATIRDADVWWAAKYALIFIAFTGVRSGEARKATWDEINLDTDTWKIPASRMKARKEHKIPLTTQAKEILAYAREHGESKHGTIFPPELGGRYMNSGSLSDLMHDLALSAVPHGSRSSFMNWASGRPHIPDPVAEMVLAHTPSDKVKKAYRTSDFFEHRIPVMQEWAHFLTESMGPVISTPYPQAKERTAGKDPSEAKATPARKKKTGGTTSANKGEPKASPATDRQSATLEIPEELPPEQPANRADRRASEARSRLKRRSERIAQNICVDAGSDPHATAPGKTRCDDCAEVHRVRRRKNDQARRERKKSELALVKN